MEIKSLDWIRNKLIRCASSNQMSSPGPRINYGGKALETGYQLPEYGSFGKWILNSEIWTRLLKKHALGFYEGIATRNQQPFTRELEAFTNGYLTFKSRKKRNSQKTCTRTLDEQ
ncbi:hypothetical protein Adt_14670 [Abeliophyllum distichum]|uniref:Uncharacterized protein n=1 Tax=Abeliophyllum distichum TaxID=126358 RepID=A0ABD1U0X0_9LAMI